MAKLSKAYGVFSWKRGAKDAKEPNVKLVCVIESQDMVNDVISAIENRDKGTICINRCNEPYYFPSVSSLNVSGAAKDYKWLCDPPDEADIEIVSKRKNTYYSQYTNWDNVITKMIIFVKSVAYFSRPVVTKQTTVITPKADKKKITSTLANKEALNSRASSIRKKGEVLKNGQEQKLLTFSKEDAVTP